MFRQMNRKRVQQLSEHIVATVLIPLKNGGKLFRSVLSAVLAQRAPWPYEVLVIDSGSRDGSLEYASAQPGVRVHQIPPEEFGHGRTRNLGVSLARGKFIALITHDAMPCGERWLQTLVGACDMAPDVAGAFGRHIAYPSAEPATHEELAAHFAGFGDQPCVVRMDDPARYAAEEGLRQFLHFFSDNNACVRRSVWERFPYPEVEFAEDQAWAKTVIEAGYGKAYAPDAVVYHSHDFGVVETLRRGFDEAEALRSLFGYVQVRSFSHGLRSWAYLSRRNLSWTRRAAIPRQSKLHLMLAAPFKAAAKLAGTYLGERAARLPGWVVNFISRDRGLRAQGIPAHTPPEKQAND